MPEFAQTRDIIAKKLMTAWLPPRLLLSRFHFIDEQSKFSRACLAPRHLPFYYHLGRYHPANNLLDMSFGIGLNSALYLMGCPGVTTYLGIQELPPSEYYSPRMGRANIRQVWPGVPMIHVGNLHDEQFLAGLRSCKWDVVLMSERKPYDTQLLWMSTAWDNMADGGILCLDNVDVDGKAYRDFCLIKNREPFVFPTRYGVGVISK